MQIGYRSHPVSKQSNGHLDGGWVAQQRPVRHPLSKWLFLSMEDIMNVIPFQYEGADVRVIDQNGEPWFVARDVALLLGYSDPHVAIRSHCKGVVKTTTPSPGGDQTIKIIPERDVYRLIMRSKMPSAERFEEWVVGEVLPQIRKTGGYSVSIPQTYSEALQLAADQAKQIEKQTEELEQARPAVQFYADVTGSKDAISMSEAAKVIGFAGGRNKLFGFLRDNGVLRHNNEPYQSYIDRGWFRVVEQKFSKPDGSIRINIKTLVYQRGLDGIIKLLRVGI